MSFLQVGTTSALATRVSGLFQQPAPFGARVVAGSDNGRRVAEKGLFAGSHACSLHALYVERYVEHGERMEQIPLRIMQEIGQPEFMPESVVARIESEQDAVAWCWALRRIKSMGVTEAARYLGMPKSHLSNIVNGKKYLPWGKRVELQRLCGNWLIRQWEDRHCGFVTTQETPVERENRMLRQRVADLEMRQAA